MVPAALRKHGYWLLVVLPLLLPASYLLRDVSFLTAWFSWIPVVILYGILPVLDHLMGRDVHNAEPGRSGPAFYPDVLVPVLVAAVYVPVLAWSLWLAGRSAGQWPALTLVGWVLSLGEIGGIAAINTAHELIHRRARWQRALGGLLLSCVMYPGFKLEHPRWHHAKVATPMDPSSADRGTTVYGQVPRAMALNTVHAWRLAVEAARTRGRAVPWLAHEMTGWWLLTLGLAGLAWMLAGALGLWVFLAQSLVAISLLEVINYIEHYGLRRREIGEGRYEPPGVQHSWNADFWLSNAILIQLQRHPDHHVHPTRPFTQLQTVPEAPQLPFGYATLSLVAMVPPLWRRLMDPRLPA